MIYEFVSTLSRRHKISLFAAMDGATIAIALLCAWQVMPQHTGPAELHAIGAVAVFAGLAMGLGLGLYRLTLNAYETRGLTRTALSAAAAGLAALGMDRYLGAGLPLQGYVTFALLVMVLATGWRVALRHVTLAIYRRGQKRMRIIVYGAGQTGQQFVAALRTDAAILPVAFVDDNPTVQGQSLMGLRVHAPTKLPDLIERGAVDRVVLTMPSMSAAARARIAHDLRLIGCEAHSLPSFAELVREGDLTRRATPISLDSLVGRNRLEKELPGVQHVYSGRRILITGAGGSIGSELCRQLLACRPEKLVLVDQSEIALYTIEKELREFGPGMEVVPVLGSVLEVDLMRRTMVEQEVEIVLHAAAYKHVPMVEANPLRGLDNNVFGTRTVAEAARDSGVDRFVLVSSDKAVRPTNVMGASKRLSELVVQDLAARPGKTRFSMVRFGNVLGSSGSVIPLFEEQIARGGPVTLTHPDVTRYFMTISEAARLVLLAGSFSRGGDLFVLDMGKPVPIRRLAVQMIEAAGYAVKDDANPQGDIEIRITGLRQGEKMHEELLIAPDMLTTPHHKILRAQEGALSEFEVATALKDLRRAIDTLDEDGARAVIARWVEGQLPAAPQRVLQGELG